MSRRDTAFVVVLSVLGIACIAGPVRAQADETREVIENHPNGSVKAKYQVDADGKKTGLFLGYFEDGKVRLRARYAKDVIQGPFETYHPNGSRAISTRYRDGKPHGPYKRYDAEGHCVEVAEYKDGKLEGRRQLFEGKDVVSDQKWKGGSLCKLDGLEPFPRSKQEIQGMFERTIPALPMVKPRSLRDVRRLSPPEPDPHLDKRVGALRRLQEYRYLCGVPYRDMWLDPEKIVYCDAACEVFRLNGEISHHPKCPQGCDPVLYGRAQTGAKSSNIHGGQDMVHSVDSYMDDSDPRNLEKGVGHRQYCLNPRMLVTAFGTSAGGSAMWAHDTSRLRLPKKPLLVCYPAPGYMPVSHFGPEHAWSVNLHPWKFGVPIDPELKVRVYPLDKGYRRGKELKLNFRRVFDGPSEFTPCLVFRPVGVEVKDGQSYWVDLEIRKQKKWLSMPYVVEFFKLPGRD